MAAGKIEIETPTTPAAMAEANEFVREAYGIYGQDRSNAALPDGTSVYTIRRNGRILGVTAILSGTDGLQIDEHYSESIESYLPAGVDRSAIIEIGRTAAARSSGAQYLFFTTLMDVVQEHAERSGATHWMAMMKQPLVAMFQKHGWPLAVLPLSPIVPEPDDPIYAYITEAPPVLLVLSSVAESIACANAMRRRTQKNPPASAP